MSQRLAVLTAALLMIGSVDVPTAEAAVPCAPHAFSVADGVIGAGSCSAARPRSQLRCVDAAELGVLDRSMSAKTR